MKYKSQFILVLFIIPYQLFGQFSGSLQSSYQMGNRPGIKPIDRNNLYNQANLQYYWDNIIFGLRIENQLADDNTKYTSLAQKYIQYQNDNFQISVGNIYEILGQGILLRTYEVPGAIYEDLGSRARYGFYKDIEGLSGNYVNDFFQIKIIYGTVLDNLKPPIDENDNLRRSVLVKGGEFNFTYFSPFQPGLLFLSSDRKGTINNYAGFNFQGYTENGFQYYSEYTQSINPEYNSLLIGNNGPYGLYSSLSYSDNIFSATFEIKDYKNYSLSINDPPALVREHSYSLLNRSTHTINPDGEKGYQFEVLLNTEKLNSISLNHSWARITYPGKTFTFYEYYGDYNHYIDDNWLAKVFFDFGKDEIINEHNRLTTGVASQNIITGSWSYGTEIQFQQFERIFELAPTQNVKNYQLSGTINHSPDFSITLLLNWLDDIAEDNYPDQTILSGFFKNILKNDYYGIDISYIYQQTNTFSLFFGERRGGTACSGGVCYAVQPFSGLELRLNSNF